jgi:predicted TIM-barrel fold metal-dependent hydrolase
VGWFDSLFEDYAAETANFQAQITSLVMSGIFNRLPGLKVAIMESGWTWMPSLMWRADREWKGLRREVPWIEDLPSNYMRKHVRLTTEPTDAPASAAELEQILQQFASNEMLMFGSDYPHRYEGRREDLLDHLSVDEAQRVRWSNAWDCFSLESRVPAFAQ